MRSDDQFATHEKRIEREQEKMGRRATCLRLLFADREHRKVEDNMSQTKTMTVRISEYVRELIRRDKERAEREAFDGLKAELTRAFAAPEESYRPLSATEVIGRLRDDRGA